MACCYVYALLEPGSERIRYVGKSLNPARRIVGHMARAASPGLREWLKSVGQPDVKILETLPSETDALIAEQAWIKRLRVGGDLLNVSRNYAESSPYSGEFSGLGSRLSIRRKELGLSQVQLAAAVGMTQSVLSRLEAGVHGDVFAASAVRLARALGCSVEWLVTGEERK